MRLKRERIGDYIDAHRKEKIWDSVVDGLKKAGFSRMIILLRDQDIILFEVAQNLKEAYDYLNRDAESVRWEKMISDWMEYYPEYNAIRGDIEFEEVPVVFYYENGTLLHV
jgi:L-rhamnose mutarotase